MSFLGTDSARAGDAPATDGFGFTPEQLESGFIRFFQRWAIQDGENLPQPDSVLAIGSSSMRLWRTISEDLEPATILHRGFGGSRMADVVLMQSFFERYGSKKILIYQGDNDLNGVHRDVERDFLVHLRAFMEGIRAKHPGTAFYLLSIKYSPARMASVSHYAAANEAMRKMAENDENVYFIDVNAAMLDAEGLPREDLFLQDRLHMSEAGYAIWREVVRAVLFGD